MKIVSLLGYAAAGGIVALAIIKGFHLDDVAYRAVYTQSAEYVVQEGAYLPESPLTFDGTTWPTPDEGDRHCGGNGTSILIARPSEPNFVGFGCLIHREAERPVLGREA